MKKEKLRHWANVISSHAESYWVTPLFFGLFLLDSIILFLPVDTLLAATITLKPKKMKTWIFFSLLGFAIGLAIVAIIVNSHLQPWLFELFDNWGYLDHVREVVAHAQDYGYIELAIGAFTILPSLFGVLIGVLVGLDPWIVWGISYAGKVVKVFLTVWLIFSSSHVLKRWLRVYLKTSV